MKFKILMALMLIIVAQGVFAGTSTFVNMPGTTDIRIVIQKYEPTPAQPGNYFDLWLDVQGVTSGSGDKTLKDFKITFIESYPFSLDPSSNALQAIGDLRPNEAITIKYRVRVADNAVYGINEIKFKVGADGMTEDIVSSPLDIDVAGIDAMLYTDKVTTIPDKLVPGETAKVEIVLLNKADTSLREVKAKLNLDSVPFAPIQSTSERYLRLIGPGTEKTLSYDIITLADATAKVYKVPLLVTYSDSTGNAYSKNYTVGFIVDATPDYEIGLEEADTFQEGTSGKVVVSISNTGAADIKFLTLKLLDGDAYEVIGKNQEYLGNLESDDFETSEFTVFAKPNGKVIKLNVGLDYKDAYNIKHSEIQQLDLKVYSQEEAVSLGLGQPKTMAIQFFIYAILVLFIYRVFKEWRKVRNIESALWLGLKSLLLSLLRILAIVRWRNLKRIPKKIVLFLKQV